VTFHIFELTAGKASSTAVFGTDGQKKINLVAKLTGKEITIEASAAGNWQVLLRGVSAIKSIQGAIYEICADGVRLTPDNTGHILVKLP
jgi:hypothetical protein